jgi:mitogen-activated protein kinase organizer 1
MPIQTYTSGYTHPITSVIATESRTAAQVLVAASQKTLVISDLVTQQLKRRLQGHHTGTINAVAAARHAEAYLSASYDGTVAIWDGRSSDYKPIQVLKDAKDSVTDVHVVQREDDGSCSSMNGAKIRTASIDGVIRTYDLRQGLVDSDDCGSPITSMAATKDGECLVVSCLDGTIRLLQVDSGELLNTYTGHKAGNYGLDVGVLANDSTIISASEDGTCILSDLVKATRVQALEVSPGRPTCSIATHPKISSVVITTSYDETTTVWSHDSSQFFWE